MIDTDDFKMINDNYGHIIGDNILKEIANAFKRIKEPNHFIGRYGGEEFIYMIESNDYNEVLEIADQLLYEAKSEVKNKIVSKVIGL